MTSRDSKPRFEALRIGRECRPFARYFVTCCTFGRKKSLADTSVAEAISRQWMMMHDEGKIRLGCGIIMPDHVHFLFATNGSYSLPQVIGRFKSKSKAALVGNETEWQPNYFEHRIRPDESWENYAQYAFLNPYRAGIVMEETSWPYWICPDTTAFMFTEHLDARGRPPVSWITEIQRPARLDPGRDWKRRGP